MTCRCGHSFCWRDVPTTVPCDCVNPHPRIGIWGRTCENPSWKAVAKLIAQRTGVVVVGALATPFILVGGVVVLVGCGIKKAINHLPSSKQESCSKAQERWKEAQSLVRAAEAELQREKERWFNHVVIGAATKSLAAKRALLLACEQDLALDSEIDSSEVTQRCWSCS